MRRLNHDLKHHLLCLREINNNYNKERAEAYLESLEKKVNQLTIDFDSGNGVLDIILIENKRKCIDKGIKFVSRFDFNSCYFIDDMDVCTLFSNILDNAYEASLNTTDPIISINGGEINGYFVFKCTNKKSNEIIKKKKAFITTKNDKSIHGIGISSINTTIKKYGGTVTYDYDDNTFTINLTIPLTESDYLEKAAVY